MICLIQSFTSQKYDGCIYEADSQKEVTANNVYFSVRQ